jgi:glutathione-specific gamma-glutamylcyclotransferase
MRALRLSPVAAPPDTAVAASLRRCGAALRASLLFGASLETAASDAARPRVRNGRIEAMEREGAAGPEPAPRRVPAPEIAHCIARGCDVWVFGYGSLMWDPGFPHVEVRPGLLRGYHRRFCVYSRRYRGTPERPGLVLGLDRGGACKGVAFRVPRGDVEAALHYLWEREMTNRTYRLRELPVATPEGAVKAQAFVVDRAQRNYTGPLSLEETARLILQGIGARGPCRQYLENTVAELKKLGLIDGPLHRLEQKVRELAEAATPCAGLPPG